MYDQNHSQQELVREIYTEHATDAGVVAEISDPNNDDAWIRSTHTMSVAP
jgi:hypothetical protein